MFFFFFIFEISYLYYFIFVLKDVIVVVLENERSEIQQTLERTPLKVKIDFVAIDSDSDFGTADSLRIIHDK